MTTPDVETVPGRLNGRVVIVTGAGRGLGAAYARSAAASGAAVVVNDLGVDLDGTAGLSPAAQVVRDIEALGGVAVASAHDIADEDGARALIDLAVERFGDLDVVVNNAGILRDAMLVSMSAADFDDVMAVHLRGHFLTSQAAARYWRGRVKQGEVRDRALIQTTSIAGLHGNIGQFNYTAAKAGIASMVINGHLELHGRYGVRSYAIAPGARTRLTENSPGAKEVVARPTDDGFDFYAPENVAPFVVWLAAPDCPAPSGSVFGVEGDLIRRYAPWTVSAEVTNGGVWTLSDLDTRAPELWPDGGNLVVPAFEMVERTQKRAEQFRAAAR
ncbi:SDR family NAD(P)-dependent oxidoreductase [Streptosporangium sp. NPDC051022]|uniref:SDR family NAD(P)-dependent oxidoreductase n=1 Tax=Streptosporangium sp. NPDC051022 TaxID=3155752 RepID=UPI00341A8D32